MGHAPKTLPGVLQLMDDPQLGMAGVLEEMLTFPHLNGKTASDDCDDRPGAEESG